MAACMQPMFIRDKKQSKYKFSVNPKHNLVPCGKCPNCLAARASSWSFRLMQEEKKSSSAYFITLTYDTTYLPISRNGYGSIRKRDLQLFFKRLRKCNDGNIKYYAVGEYGGKLKRPHYHVILFNAALDTIQSAWGQGHIHYGEVTGASVGYTLKYISKPYRNFKLNDDREKPFSLMSKGLGANYLSQARIDWHHADLEKRMYVPIEGNKKCTMPRYYKDRIYSEEQKKVIAAAARQRFAEEILKDILKFSSSEQSKNGRNRREAKEAARNQFKLQTQNA